MARTKDPAVRTLLIERAAHMLRTREPITLRSLVAGTGVSTMAVYTHFAGMDGMWRALRQEGFSRLAARLETVRPPDDPVEELTALLGAYAGNALDHPDLYRVMFDASYDLLDTAAAEETREFLVRAAARARDAGRFRADADPRAIGYRSWIVVHGLVSLVTSHTLSRKTLADGVPMLTALFTDAGDEPERCRSSVRRAWI